MLGGSLPGTLSPLITRHARGREPGGHAGDEFSVLDEAVRHGHDAQRHLRPDSLVGKADNQVVVRIRRWQPGGQRPGRSDGKRTTLDDRESPGEFARQALLDMGSPSQVEAACSGEVSRFMGQPCPRDSSTDAVTGRVAATSGRRVYWIRRTAPPA